MRESIAPGCCVCVVDRLCWPIDTGVEPAVIFYDQKTQHASPVAPSFTEWLAMNRL
jgi:hypothetical protein